MTDKEILINKSQELKCLFSKHLNTFNQIPPQNFSEEENLIKDKLEGGILGVDNVVEKLNKFDGNSKVDLSLETSALNSAKNIADVLEGKIDKNLQSKEIIPPIYLNILVENYRAYLQNEEGFWAEYDLKSNQFRSNFIYSDIQIDAQKGFVTAKIENKQIVLHSPFVKTDSFICKDENGLYGVKQGETWLIPAEYDFISLWKDSDRFEVYKDGKYGLFDCEGHCIFSCRYDSFDAPTSDMLLFKVCVDCKWGVVSCGDNILHDCTLNDGDSELLESIYLNCINQMINRVYSKRSFLHLQLLKRNISEGYILMKIVGFNRTFKIYRNFLPEQVFNKCMNSYWEAINTLKQIAIRVNEKGKIIVDYPATLKWLEYRKKLYSLKRKETVNGIVYSINNNRIIVKLENDVFGVMLEVVDKYVVGEQLQLIVERVENTKVLLRELKEM